MFVTALALALAAGAGQTEPTPAPAREAVNRDAALTTGVWRAPRPPPEPHWKLLQVPGWVVETSFAPIYPIVLLAEEYRLDQRIYDTFSNESHTAYVAPIIAIGGPDIFRGGLRLAHAGLLEGMARLQAFAAIAVNGDWVTGGEYRQAVAHLNGRVLSAAAGFEANQNFRFYGVGGDTDEGNKSVMSVNTLFTSATAELFGPGFLYLSGVLHLGYTHQTLEPGDDPPIPSIEPGGSVPPPLGFERSLDYLGGGFSLLYDSRDALGRTTRGTALLVDASLLHDVNGAEASAIRGLAHVATYLEVLPLHRVLVLSAGLGAATPWESGRRLPLEAQLVLDRRNHLRGYPTGRFRDNAAWWAGAEYRYPIYLFQESGVGLTWIFFGELGRAGHSFEQLFARAPRWSLGLGTRLDAVAFSIFSLQAGFSPEGFEAFFLVGEGL